jgi:hypothetical protein
MHQFSGLSTTVPPSDSAPTHAIADVGLVVNRECSADQRVDLTSEPASSVS